MADNGRIALDKLESEPGIELVIMDIMTGDREKCIEGRANDYMTKPVDTDNLLFLIRVWLFK